MPLGGVRAMSVHRSLPQRDLPLVGAWCFLDRFGPQVTRMRVEPHPHIGLQTVTWPFAGDIRHRDSVGSDVVVRRGALNLMTSGEGIAHSEYSIGEEPVDLDALQLWVALPESRRHGAPAFERHEELPRVDLAASAGQPADGDGRAGRARRSLLARRAPTRRSSVRSCGCLRARASRFRSGRTGSTPSSAWRASRSSGPASRRPSGPSISTAATCCTSGHGRDAVERRRATGGALLFLLGGEPFEDDIVMWWNFVGRSHEEIVDARDAWEAGGARFGHVVDHGDERVPAPPLPACG